MPLPNASGPMAQIMRYAGLNRPLTRRVLEEMFERIPGLEKQYSPQSLGRMAMMGASKEELPMVYRPESFEKLAWPLDADLSGASRELDIDSKRNIERLRRLLREGRPFDEVPFLHLRSIPRSEESGGASLLTVGHEGRHRSRALASFVDTPLSLLSVKSGYSGNPTVMQNRMVRADPEMRILNQILGETNDGELSQNKILRRPDLVPRYADVFEGAPILGRARGGAVERQVNGYAAGGMITSPLAMMKMGLNMVARPFQRAGAKNYLNLEARRSGEAEIAPEVARSRYEGARNQIGAQSPLSSLPYADTQGAWMGEKGLELNRAFSTPTPATLGRTSWGGALGTGEAQRYGSAMGQGLGQEAVGLTRATSSLFNIPEGADAVIVKGVADKDIAAIAQAVGEDVVVSARPNGEAVIFSTSGEPSIAEIAKKVKQAAPKAQLNYGVSKEGVDRAYISKETYGARGGEELWNRSAGVGSEP